MTATLNDPRPTAPPLTRNGGLRERLASLERPLMLAGLTLVALHLLDLAFSGPETSLPGVLAIVAVPVAWALARPHVTRPTRLVLGVVIGLVTLGFGVISHGLHVVNSGPDWIDVTGVGVIAGGILLIAAGLTAIAAPRRAPRRPALGWRLAHGAGWITAVPVFTLVAVMPFAMALRVTHAPRWAISGTEAAPSLIGLMPRIAPRPVLLIAGGIGAPDEIPTNRAYRTAAGPTTQLWELPDAGHTGGLRTHPAAYEQRTTTFLDQALGLKETS
jgi:hypothetical protein